MATVFGCNLEAVDSTAAQLHTVHDELSNFSRRDDAYSSALSSSTISGALDDFYNDSSDQRDKIKDGVKAIADMLTALGDGVRQVDQALYDGLAEATPADAGGGGGVSAE